MINEIYKTMLRGKSIIRELSEYATARGREIGYDNVFDYSLGNPSVPCPHDYTEGMIRLLRDEDPMAVHGYSPSLGIDSVRKAVADSLNRRFGMDYEARHIFMASGAAGALAHAFRCVTVPGDEILTFAPFFPEYGPYVNLSGARLKVVPADTESFQINFQALEETMNEKVMAVLINTPNNPSGAVYSTETIEKLADFLERKQKEYGHDIFLISDEPYREIVFEGADVPYVSGYYDNSISCYSYSKSLSLPGERIGYIVIPGRLTEYKKISPAIAGAARVLGFVCAPVLFQQVAARCVEDTGDIEAYRGNRDLLLDGLTRLGYSCVPPQGAFYLFVKALEEDANAFCERAKKYDLLLVPSDDFGCPGYVRIAYCVAEKTIVNAMPAFEKLMEEYR